MLGRLYCLSTVNNILMPVHSIISYQLHITGARGLNNQISFDLETSNLPSSPEGSLGSVMAFSSTMAGAWRVYKPVTTGQRGETERSMWEWMCLGEGALVVEGSTPI